MISDEEWEKLVKFNKLQKRDYCDFCKRFIYCRHRCKTQERADVCPRLHPKPRPPKPPAKTTCIYCGSRYDNPQALGGHMVSCKKNPKAEARRLKIAESKKGHEVSAEQRKKTRETVNKTNQLKKDGKYDKVKTLKTTDDKVKIKLKFKK